ncbi:diaminopimelate decarboxylase [Clostridium thermosuccinogenes]|jgi:diaminopimelate decarboxylase|nr:diaminopimelate decarboxylase [Pseudoclostridium thermosuccinogenes]
MEVEILKNYFTEQTNFFKGISPFEIIKEYGSPLYVYNESILRQRCREMKNFITYPNFSVNYSTKANSNLELLKIVREEGLNADAMSPGEIYVLLAAGFKPEQIFYISNNVSAEEMKYAIEKGIILSADSLSQLELYGKLNPGGKVAVRFNPGVGAGHHEKVVTAGKKTKFGVNMDYISEVKEILKRYDLKLVGINQHIGSLFMEGKPYIEGVKSLLDIAKQFDDLEFVDLGGGFGIPYRKQEGQERLELKDFGSKLDQVLKDWVREYGKDITFKIEPGRYIVAECSVLLGTVHSIKNNYGVTYAGTDIGFNVLARPVMYDSHHDIEVYREGKLLKSTESDKPVYVVGNICESGDILAKDRMLPELKEGDILGIMDAGAYGYSMSSNYNNRLRPAEVLIRENGSISLIRRRDTLEDLMRNFDVDSGA